TEGLRGDGEAVAAALNGGYHLAYLVGAALTVVAIVVALVVLRFGKEAEAPAHAEPAYDAA
ncbi:MAG: MFS transporter, partial [Thermoleophilaceae bacterium]